MKFKFSLFFALFVFLITGAPSFVSAGTEPELLGKFGKWRAYRYQEGGADVCFVSVSPDKSEGKYKSRDPVYLMVTHRPSESSRNVVSFLAGYSVKQGQEVVFHIDGDGEFVLLGQDDAAWTPDAGTDEKLVSALKKGRQLVVNGVSLKGTQTRDSFSLKGSGDALGAIDKACK